ncbi:arsenate resistance ArsH [Wallemia mellicola CBS 633.66]|uniref:Arsenate resistance ArsH n=1 Tax=Wallemia mellicola (strain ATCC MYA-4683 / CBS 633.66) TaxID=671144 RepID=I4YIN7_WALMC|nr:arsenate resistance ArsH [Wallemia mellicola CBS 633.66]EIM23829.1 arsenate resistance ArsH [Wallemia mellicola CBS 633.66]|eukprot:XP_006955676.1 arsenate resistance ArsH [Wallemia mellicola CBS 633.66]
MSSTITKYQPYLAGLNHPGKQLVPDDWTFDIANESGRDELRDARLMHAALPNKLKVLILYGSLRQRSYSQLLSFEIARILHHIGVDVRVFNPDGLPLKDDSSEYHPKVQELRQLVSWSEANFWVSPEQHGAITGIMKTQIDHIPLSLGSIRPTQGKILAVAQVNGGSQSFNAVNTLRLLGRWMRMHTIPNQSSVPKAWTAFSPEGRFLPISNRDRVVDVCEELVKVSCLFYGKHDLFASRWSERKEKEIKGRLLSQEEKENENKKSS